jgi:hypothetical protein
MKLFEISVGTNVMFFMDWLELGPADQDDVKPFMEFGSRLFKDGWKWDTRESAFSKDLHTIAIRRNWVNAGWTARFSGPRSSAKIYSPSSLRDINVDDLFAQLDARL